jgi:glutathione S-transferase
MTGRRREAAMLRIWGRANSSNVQKVLWCCEELGVAYERIDAGGSFGRTQDPEYLAMNPNARVPTIQDGEAVIWESNTILRYLATTRGGARLYPSEPVARSHVERWMDWQLAHLTPPMTTLLFQLFRTPPAERRPAEIEAARARAQESWTLLDRQLGRRDHLAGASFSLADICVGIFAYRWLNFDIRREPTPHLAAWFDRIKARPGCATHVLKPIT